jgi:hypothetical protein
MLYYALSLPIVLATYFALRRLAFDRVSLCIIGAAMALCLSHFFHSQWTGFSHDAAMHSEYVRYIAEHLALPPVDLNPATRHAPAFYIMAAAFYKLGQWAQAAEPLEYARYAAMVLYFTFMVFAALTLRRMFPAKSEIYHLCLAMLLFWPVGITKVGVLNCDVLLYAGEMAVIFFLLCWIQERKTLWLTGAFYGVAVALLAKNSAILLLGLALAFLCHALWRHRRLVTPQLLLAIGVALLCAYVTMTRNRMVGYTLSTIPYSFNFHDILYMYFYFNPYSFLVDTAINPHDGEPITNFWHYYLRSLLLGDYITWKALALLFAFGAVWLLVIAYIVYGLWKVKIFPENEKQALRFLLFVPAMLTGMLLYMFYVTPHPSQIADGRYVYPIVCIVMIFYGKAMQWHRAAGRGRLYLAGRGLGLGFVMLTLLLFAAQDYWLTRIQ